jgi:DNA-binding response OmpR family regulator
MLKHCADILIVEDDPLVASSLGDVLAIAGVRHVELAGNGDAALRALASGRRFDLALVDLMIPPPTGLAVAADAIRRNIPVLLTSGDLATLEAAGPAGITVLAKPFPVDRLLAEAQAAIEAAHRNLAVAVEERQRLAVNLERLREARRTFGF